MPSKAKSALLNGTLEAPEDSFLGEMIDEDPLKKVSSNDFIKTSENIESLEESSPFNEFSSNDSFENDESEFLKSKNDVIDSPKEEKISTEFIKEDLVEDIEGIEEYNESLNDIEIPSNENLIKNEKVSDDSPDIHKSVEVSKPHRRRGRPKSDTNIKEEKEDISMPNSQYDEIIKILANNLIDSVRKTNLTIDGFDANQIQPIYDYIKCKINS